MNEIVLWNNSMPTINGCDQLVASEDFLHADRTLDFHVLIYVTEGAIYVTEEQTDYCVGEGELLFLKAGCHHYGKYTIARGTRWHFVHFYLDAPAAHARTVSPGIEVRDYTLASDMMTLPKMLSELAGSSIEEHFLQLTGHAHTSDSATLWNQNQLLFTLLTDIAFFQKAKYPSVPAAKSLSERICTYLSQHASEPFQAELLEAHFYLSYKHMAAVFKKEKQLTMQQYHTDIRMKTACQLLKTTLLPVGEIAESLGYSDMLYFSKCFRKHTGKSPSAYRKSRLSVY